MPTYEWNEDQKELISEIYDKLRDITKAEHIIKYYWKAGLYAERLITRFLREPECKLPVDVEKLAEKMGISIEEDDLNEFSRNSARILNKKISQLVIRRDFYTNERVVTIYVDKMTPPSSRRYAIANQIAHFLFNYTEERCYENYFIMPMCPTKMEEIAADIFSIFLLIPIREFFQVFREYAKNMIETQKVPIITEEWIRHLAEKSVLSEYYVTYGYQYLRGIGYWVYQACKENVALREKSGMSREECIEIRKWAKEYYTEDMTKLLYQ